MDKRELWEKIKMKMIFYTFFFVLVACSSLKVPRNTSKYHIDQLEKILVGFSEQNVARLFGKPRKNVDINKYKKGANRYGWYYHDDNESSQYKMAVFFDSKKRTVIRTSWFVTSSDKIHSFESFKKRYSNKKFVRRQGWHGAHSGGGFIEYESKDRSVSLILDKDGINVESVGLVLDKPL